MSEESPWGTPPPSSPPPGGYGPPASNPPAAPPPPPGWGPPTSYGAPPPGPPTPPPRRHVGVIVAAVLAAVLVVVAVVVSIVVTSGDDDDPQSADPTSSATTAPTTEPTTEATTEPTTEPTDEPTDEPTTGAAGSTITGDGYSYELPGKAWTNAYAEASEQGIGATLDTIIILGSSIELAQSNILVEALSAGTATDVDELAEQWKRNLSGADGAVPSPIDDTTIDGDRAIGVEFRGRTNQNGVDIDQVCYLVLHAGNQYSIALSYPSAGDNVSEADFAKLLASWTWLG